MAKNSFYVNLILNEPQCSMISPGYEYLRTNGGLPQRKEWHPDNLNTLEDMVSKTMLIRHTQQLVETLEKKIPSLYIDCSKRWDDDIMLFIFKEYIKQSPADNKANIVGNVIWDHSVATKSRADRNEYIKNDAPVLETLLQQYSQNLRQLLDANDDEKYTKNILNRESDITFNGLGKLMKNEWEKYLCLYLDKIQTLTIGEKQRINTFLYTRWSIPQERWIRLKINNGQWAWRTRYSSVGQKIESPHDYSESTIRENELE